MNGLQLCRPWYAGLVRGAFGAHPLLAGCSLRRGPPAVRYDFTTGKPSTIFDASLNYKAADIPLVVLAGKEYGTVVA